MGITKQIIKQGDEINYPRTGQTVSVHYTGYLNGTIAFRLKLK